jgi:hypothetical protein
MGVYCGCCGMRLRAYRLIRKRLWAIVDDTDDGGIACKLNIELKCSLFINGYLADPRVRFIIAWFGSKVLDVDLEVNQLQEAIRKKQDDSCWVFRYPRIAEPIRLWCSTLRDSLHRRANSVTILGPGWKHPPHGTTPVPDDRPHPPICQIHAIPRMPEPLSPPPDHGSPLSSIDQAPDCLADINAPPCNRNDPGKKDTDIKMKARVELVQHVKFEYQFEATACKWE